MQEIISQILILLRGGWRYRWPAVAVAWLVAIGGWIAVQFVPDKYIREHQGVRGHRVAAEAAAAGPRGRSRRDDAGRHDAGASCSAARTSRRLRRRRTCCSSAKTRREQEAVIDSLASRIELGRPSGPAMANTFVVSFKDNDPKVAHQVVRTLLDTFMEDSLGLKRIGRRSRAALPRVADQGLRAEARSRPSSVWRRFKQQNVGLLPGSGGGYYQRLETEMGQLQQLQQAYAQLQTRRDELERQLQGEEPTFGLMGSAEGSPIDGQIARFKAQRDALLLQYTEKHPQVQTLNDTIERLEAEKRAGAKVSTTVAAAGHGHRQRRGASSAAST